MAKAHENDLAERVTALEEQLAALKGEAAPVATDTVLAGADLALLVDALRPLGVNGPPEGLLVRWLARWSREQILAALDRVLRTWHGQATAPGAPAISPGADWREIAAYLESRQSHLGWARVQYLLETGEMPADPASMDPLESVFQSLPADAGREQIAALVPEVLRRAELGITWAGNQGTQGEDLATRKAILAAGPGDPRFLPEWRAFRDTRLLRVVLLPGPLTLTRGLGAYSLHGLDPSWTLEEYLVVQRQFSATWPGRPIEAK
jgi:hypothetical protein